MSPLISLWRALYTQHALTRWWGILSWNNSNHRKVLHGIVATIAFGMGLDCPNVHCIIHCGPLQKVETFMTMWTGPLVCGGALVCAWWRSVTANTVVRVRFPHKRHGDAGKISYSAKTSYLQFVGVSSGPNGRLASSSGPTSSFIPKFSISS